MIVMLWYTLTLVGPDLAAAAAGAPARLPDGGVGWECVGTFRLTDAKGTAVVVRVYAYDSDVAVRKGLTDLKFRPNHFDLHAMYRVGAGEWKHRQLLSTARVRFERVKERTPDGAVLELRSNVLVDLRDLDRARRAGRDVNPPFTRKLTLKDGLPVIVE